MTGTKVFAPRENVNDEVVTIVEFFAADGDFVAHDGRLLLLETSKSTFEVYAPQAGYVKFLVEIQADVPIDQPLCILCETAESALAATSVTNGARYKVETDCKVTIKRKDHSATRFRPRFPRCPPKHAANF